MDAEPVSLDRLREIPDPAAGLPMTPAPPATVPAEPSATRPERARLRMAAVTLAAVWLVGTAAALGLRPDLASPTVLVPVATWVAGAAVALGVVLRPRARGLPAGIRAVQHAVWVVPATYVVVAAAVAGPPNMPFAWATLRGCLGVSFALSLGVLVAAGAALRRSFPSAAGWRGAAVGAVAGLAGATGIHAHCPAQGLDHLLVAHGAAIALSALAGAALGRLGGRP
jgi:hypothetical protein